MEKSNLNVLALDLGTKTGWAVRRRDGTIGYGTEKFASRSGRHAGLRWTEYRRWLSDIIVAEHVSQIAYEDVKNHAGTLAAHCYGGFLSMTEMVAQQHNVTLVAFGVGTIKRAWAGKGNADKAAMIAEAHRRGFNPADDNTADALAILHLALMALAREAA
ncbi:MAG: hypothetical protein AB7E55_03275 [Pigmentiphaga sp.]